MSCHSIVIANLDDKILGKFRKKKVPSPQKVRRLPCNQQQVATALLFAGVI